MAARRLLASLLALSLWVMPGQAVAATVILDAGHGGKDPGAVSATKLQEKDVNLDITRRVADLLIKSGYSVAMTRDTDVYLSLSERVAYARNTDADIFVSIHANAHTSHSVRGALVLYYDHAYPQDKYPASSEMKLLTPESRELARLVQDGMVEQTGIPDRGLVPSSVYVVRMGNMPSILVETAFLSNSTDAALLASTTFRQQISQGIAQGIQAYLPLHVTFPDTRSHWARESILRLNELGIVTGSGDNKYEPDRAVTRAELATLLGRIFPLDKLAAEAAVAMKAPSSSACAPKGAAGSGASGSGDGATESRAATDGAVNSGSTPSGATDKCKEAQHISAPKNASDFKDVLSAHWAYAQLDLAVKSGLLSGYEDGTLRPDAVVSRAEAAVMLNRLVKPPTTELTFASFSDVPREHWAFDAVSALVSSGLVQGITDQTFALDRKLTRAEAAVLMDRHLHPSKP
ncbi:N-acetylmuramoyl-L-alanine amidase [Paenibacillus sp. YYML68]|uniref:N-acetylmuramoyl-L-alanine amidase n=1 Tax=Paenibacillus sp. YYML68 TaxID=2909250 RepID=UPI0024931280|nr:N-acetylmuramoyl-L-alanine amidase [Paenibacillus sp. YYML68]